MSGEQKLYVIWSTTLSESILTVLDPEHEDLDSDGLLRLCIADPTTHLEEQEQQDLLEDHTSCMIYAAFTASDAVFLSV